jgi:hypothetical protein
MARFAHRSAARRGADADRELTTRHARSPDFRHKAGLQYCPKGVIMWHFGYSFEKVTSET